MEKRDVQKTPDAGMLGADREIFAQVWSRVSPGENSVIEPVAAPVPAAAPSQSEQETAQVREVATADQTSRQLRELVLGCLTDGSVYRDLARRTRRSVSDLQELYGQKLRQAKRLSAAYFLMTGVRYWPREVTPVNPPEAFFPALRERYLAEGRLAGQLKQLAGACQDEALGEIYQDLARETHDMTRTIRLIVERET